MSLRSLLLSSFYGPVSDVHYDFGGIIFRCLRIWVNVSGLFSATIRKIFWEGMMHLCVVLNTLMQQVRFCSAHIHLCLLNFLVVVLLVCDDLEAFAAFVFDELINFYYIPFQILNEPEYIYILVFSSI